MKQREISIGNGEIYEEILKRKQQSKVENEEQSKKYTVRVTMNCNAELLQIPSLSFNGDELELKLTLEEYAILHHLATKFLRVLFSDKFFKLNFRRKWFGLSVGDIGRCFRNLISV